MILTLQYNIFCPGRGSNPRPLEMSKKFTGFYTLPPPQGRTFPANIGGASPRISKYWGGAKSKKSPKYLVLNGRKKPKYLVLKKPKTFMTHLGLKQHSIALYFRFLLHFYA